METSMQIGLEAISFYTPHYYIELSEIARARSECPDTFGENIGQEKMAVPPPGEDVVTMAANAARPIVESVDPNTISSLLFATESGIDQSKAGGIFIHNLLGLPARCRVCEIKQACYGATAALQMSLPMLAANPKQKVLIIASDVARYGLGTPGEATQGGGAVALLLSANPTLLAFDQETGYYTEDVMDFWRPNYRDEALVDGKASVRIYIKSLLETWRQYQEATQRTLTDFHRFCYHLPFTRMADTAHRKLLKANGLRLSEAEVNQQLADSQYYNRITGNSYAASLYVALASLLDRSDESLENQRIALFSYGSGCMAEFFSATVLPGYRQHLFTSRHQAMLASRAALTYPQYREFYEFGLPTDGGIVELPRYETAGYRLSGVRGHKRIYETIGEDNAVAAS